LKDKNGCRSEDCNYTLTFFITGRQKTARFFHEQELNTMWKHFGFTNNLWCGPGAFFPGPFGMIMTILIWMLIVVLVVKLFQFLFRNKNENIPDILEIIKTRYAQGEISKEEFEQMKLTLK
jgi:uncharacterized membrane protein